MRFPRNAKIFRGQLDFAPLAGVLFLLVIFLLLGSLISPPGIRIQLATQADLNKSPEKKFVSVTRKSEIIYEGKTNRLEDLEQLRLELKKIPTGETVLLQIDPGAPKEVGARVRQMLETTVQLASSENLESTENKTLAVAINLNGQFFFDNELVTEIQLRDRLKKVTSQSKDPYTLLVFADKSTTGDIIFRLGQIAEQAGIKELSLAGQVKKAASASVAPKSQQ